MLICLGAERRELIGKNAVISNYMIVRKQHSVPVRLCSEENTYQRLEYSSSLDSKFVDRIESAASYLYYRHRRLVTLTLRIRARRHNCFEELPFPPDVREEVERAGGGEVPDEDDYCTHRIAIGRKTLRRQIELLEEYRTRLIADVVTGKLDVREAAAGLADEGDDDLLDADGLA